MNHRIFRAAVLASLFGCGQTRADWVTLEVPWPSPPGSSSSASTVPNGISGNNIVGWYEDATRSTHGFLYNGTSYTALNVPGAYGALPSGISGNNVVGTYVDATGEHGFLYNGTSFTTLNAPGATAGTYARGISGNNVAGGYFDARGNHGFLYNGTSYTTLNVPGGYDTHTSGISGNKVVGDYWDARGQHGFLYNGNSYTTLNVPGPRIDATQAAGISGGKVVGSYVDTTGAHGGPHGFSGRWHGFLYNGTSYTTLDNPLGAEGTQLLGISGDNIVGQYEDARGEWHGFVYQASTPEPSSLVLLGMAAAPLAACGCWRRWTTFCASDRPTRKSPASPLPPGRDSPFFGIARAAGCGVE